MINWLLLVFVLVTIFAAAGLAILPLAGFELPRDSSVTGSPQRGAQRSLERHPDRSPCRQVFGWVCRVLFGEK